jgi:hypothetical protein
MIRVQNNNTMNNRLNTENDNIDTMSDEFDSDSKENENVSLYFKNTIITKNILVC